MEIAYLILRDHVDLITFAVLLVLGLIFCQLLMRSAQVGASLPTKNVIATLAVGLASVTATFGVSRLYEHHQRVILEGVAHAAALDVQAALAGSSGDRQGAIGQVSKRWHTAIFGLDQFQVFTTRGDKTESAFDTGNDIDRNGRIEGTNEVALPAGAPPPSEMVPEVNPAKGGLSPYLRVYSGHHYIRVGSALVVPGDNTPLLVGLTYRASPWCLPVVAARFVPLLLGLCIIGLLLARPCLTCIHDAELVRRQRVEEALKKAREAADAESRKKGELMVVLTDEIRTPLTAIMGFSRVLQGSALDRVQQRHVETIVSAGDRLAAILNDVLDLTKIEEGKLTLDQLDHSPVAVMTEIVDLMTSQATKKNLTLRLETGLRESFVIRGDPTRLRQVVLRLVDNAIKYTDRGSVTVRLSWAPLSPGAEDGTLTVSVVDTGLGIPADRLANLFTTFQHSESPQSRHTGNGLSLVMAKRLVDVMGGRLNAVSTPTVGSTFTLTLPCTPKAAAVPAPEAIEASSNSRPAIMRRALVVDDQALNREIVRLMLQRIGYIADTASAGEEAVGMAKATRFDIIFLDLDMPGMDGYATTAKIRALSAEHRQIPIVAVTGITEKGTREKCLGAGMNEYLTKPVYAPALKSTVAAVLGPLPTG